MQQRAVYKISICFGPSAAGKLTGGVSALTAGLSARLYGEVVKKHRVLWHLPAGLPSRLGAMRLHSVSRGAPGIFGEAVLSALPPAD